MYTLLSYLQPLLLPSETPFARYVKEHIFNPLGLVSTTYSYDTAKASGQLADGMTRQGIRFSENPFGNGTVRALPFWSTIGGEDGNSKFVIHAQKIVQPQGCDSYVWARWRYKQCLRYGVWTLDRI
jgi:CubicO group peptidase (beta-lactamase class C family)